MKVCLWNLLQPVLIIKAKTGLFYYNQTAGTACIQNEQEGFIIPTALSSFDFGYDCDYDGFSLELADEFDKLMQENLQPIQIDREMLQYSFEAWAHVNIIDNIMTKHLLFDIGLPYPIQAVMTWDNSD